MGSSELIISQISDEAKETKAIIETEIVVGMKDSLRLSAATFNQITELRRKMVVKGLADFKGAKERLDQCQPNSEHLFGADLGELPKAIRNEAQFKGKRPGKCSLFQKRSNEGQKNQGQSDRGKNPKSSFSKGKKTFQKKKN